MWTTGPDYFAVTKTTGDRVIEFYAETIGLGK